MSKRRQRGIWIAVGIVVLAAVLLTAAYYPRSFAQAMGEDYDRQRLDHISIYLSHPEQGQSREITLSPADPATEDLLALLEGQRYRPVYHNPWTPISGRALALDYWVHGVFVFQEEEDGSAAVSLSFDGNPEIGIGPGGVFRRGYRLDPAVQQQLLDLLTAQPAAPAE